MFSESWRKGLWKGKKMSDDNIKRSQKAWQYVDKEGMPKLNGQVGINQLNKISRNICEWKNTTHELYKEDDPSTHFLYFTEADMKMFTPHSIRRTGATILAASDLPLELLMIAGNWKSPTVARGYIANSILTKRKIAEAMSNAVKVGEENIYPMNSEGEFLVSCEDDDTDESNCKRRCVSSSSVVTSIVYNITIGNVTGGSVVSTTH